mmetsp:Transcript_114280/g.198691  ORF Transcript_114280/g.198691 Transcript_114280/m.198691 type:complete len:237 (-) Transcript_114280:275-985(-)
MGVPEVWALIPWRVAASSRIVTTQSAVVASTTLCCGHSRSGGRVGQGLLLVDASSMVDGMPRIVRSLRWELGGAGQERPARLVGLSLAAPHHTVWSLMIPGVFAPSTLCSTPSALLPRMQPGMPLVCHPAASCGGPAGRRGPAPSHAPHTVRFLRGGASPPAHRDPARGLVPWGRMPTPVTTPQCGERGGRGVDRRGQSGGGLGHSPTGMGVPPPRASLSTGPRPSARCGYPQCPM